MIKVFIYKLLYIIHKFLFSCITHKYMYIYVYIYIHGRMRLCEQVQYNMLEDGL